MKRLSKAGIEDVWFQDGGRKNRREGGEEMELFCNGKQSQGLKSCEGRAKPTKSGRGTTEGDNKNRHQNEGPRLLKPGKPRHS